MVYPSESSEQIAFVNWFRINYPELIIFSVPNGGFRNVIEAKRLKDEGVLAGSCDILVLMPKGKSLFIEFKKQVGGTISKEQKKFMKELERLEFDYFVAYGFRDGVEKLQNYFKNGEI